MNENAVYSCQFLLCSWWLQLHAVMCQHLRYSASDILLLNCNYCIHIRPAFLNLQQITNIVTLQMSKIITLGDILTFQLTQSVWIGSDSSQIETMLASARFVAGILAQNWTKTKAQEQKLFQKHLVMMILSYQCYVLSTLKCII